MAYKAKAYTLREESTESGIRYFISFKDGQGEHHELEVSEQLFFEFRQMERRNRNLLQWDERHREFSEVWDETLNRRALKLPKSIEEQMIEAERAELLCKAVDRLPEIQRRRFLLYYEYEFNFYQIAAMTDTARKRNLFFICVGLAVLHTLTFFVGVNLFLRRSTPMCNKNKITARKEETHAEVTDSQRRNAPL